MLAALILLTLSVRPAMGYSLEGPIWILGQTKFSYVISGDANSPYSTAMKTAMADWNAVSFFQFVPDRKSHNPCNAKAPNGVAFEKTSCFGKAFGSTTLAVTFYNYGPFGPGKQFTHAGTVFNANVPFNVYSGRLLRNVIDFRRVAVHELGHVLGLAHETNSSIPAIMAPSVSDIEKPTADDVAGVKALY